MSKLSKRFANQICSEVSKEKTSTEITAPENALSYVKGIQHPPLSQKTIPQFFKDAVSHFSTNVAVIFPEQKVKLTYNELDKAIDDVARGLLALGLEKGDRVGILSPNRLEWILTQFATARVGLVLVNINPAYRLNELKFGLNKVGCKALISAQSFKTSDYVGMIKELAPEMNKCKPGQLRSAQLPSLRAVIFIGSDQFHGALSFHQLSKLGGPAEQSRLSEISGLLNRDEAINIQFTSGTTGAPKGATLSHYNIINNARFVTDCIQLTEFDRLAIPVPLYHCFGMVMGVLGAVSKGATMVFPGEGFDAAQTLNVIAKEKCTAIYGVPTMFVAMLDLLEVNSHDLSDLRTGIMAGAPCPIEIMKRVNSEMNMKQVTIAYGMTETSPVSFQSFIDDPITKRCETVGRIHPHLEVKIIDSNGKIVPVGTQGELCTRGYSVMKGYWHDDAKTAESIVNGWMHTGDLAVLDEEGFCSIVGRVKDMIIRGGENIYPREIEEQLIRHPKVSNVQVFGIPDEKYGETVCAWAIAKPGESLYPSELRQMLEGQVAHYKVPKHIRIVEELPMTITGKPQKFIMRDKMIAILKEDFNPQ
ncbi:MAG: AMP-binding protein [Aestuariivita sp.]|nr:AMP-binding protein [Aestuariivita sp.]